MKNKACASAKSHAAKVCKSQGGTKLNAGPKDADAKIKNEKASKFRGTGK